MINSAFCHFVAFTSHWGSAGLEDNCSSRFLRATEVRYRGNTCYIVRPNQQCVTYRNCRRRRGPCAYGGVITKGKRSFLHGVFRRQILDKGKDPCYGTSMSSSTCLPDGYRTFYVWIYCDYYGFRLINIELPQCCSCKKYNNCY
uniref:Uncharacterized protein n=1 Tax=Magallana gigas TaxID=29159 RepID=K1Q0K4_MAGGI